MSPISRRTLLGALGVAPVAAGVVGGARAAGVLGGARAAQAAPATRRRTPPRVVSVAPNTALTGLLDRYSDSGAGWTGADSTYSTRLPDGRQVWRFSDTFLGPVNADGSRPTTAPFLNNSYVVQDGQRLSTVHGGTAGAPDGLFPPPETDHWYWLGDAVVDGGMLNQILIEFARTGTGTWDFGWVGTSLARLRTDRLDRVVDVHPLPSATSVTWASWLQPVGGDLYVYGVEDGGASKYLHLARVAGRNLLGPWQYWTGSSWSLTESDSARVLEGVGNEYSVTPWRGGWLLVTQDTTELFSPKIVAYVADRPTGPFTGKTLL